MTLTSDQIDNLLTDHCYRVLNNMNHDDLLNYAMQMMKESFDKNLGIGDTDVDMLMRDIFIAEDQDEDSVYEFLIGSGIEDEITTDLINQHNE